MITNKTIFFERTAPSVLKWPWNDHIYEISFGGSAGLSGGRRDNAGGSGQQWRGPGSSGERRGRKQRRRPDVEF